MGVYRVEASPNNRAGCQVKACKDNAVKITKGEFRFAVQVTIQEHQSWQYRHWGCVTPKQIENLIETCGGDTDLVDGYDELPAEFQEKVKYALENGHVADEDWKGDPGLNRPGQKGVKRRAPKQKASQKDDEDEKNEDEVEAKPKSKKRTRKVKDDDKDDGPAPSKKRGRPSKKEVKEEEEDDIPTPPPKKSRGRPKKIDYKEASGSEDVPPPKKTRGKKKPMADEEVEENGHVTEEDDEEEEVPKPKRGKKKDSTTVGNLKVPQKKGRRN